MKHSETEESASPQDHQGEVPSSETPNDDEIPKLRLDLDSVDISSAGDSDIEKPLEQQPAEEKTESEPEAGEISLSSPEDESDEIKLSSGEPDTVGPKEPQEGSEPKNEENSANQENPSP